MAIEYHSIPPAEYSTPPPFGPTLLASALTRHLLYISFLQYVFRGWSLYSCFLPPSCLCRSCCQRSHAAWGRASTGREGVSCSGTAGQGSGTKRPRGSGTWASKATRIRVQPRRKTLTSRRRVARRVLGCVGTKAVTSGTVLARTAASAS